METHRILMVSTFYPPYHIGGDAVHVKYLTDELTRAGHEVHIIHSLDAYALKKQDVNEIANETHIHRVQTALGSVSAVACHISGRNRCAERMVDEISREMKSDIIHYHNISLMGHGVLQKGRGKKIYTAHDHWALCQRNDYMRCGEDICTDRQCIRCTIKSHRPARITSSRKIISKLDNMDAVISPSTYMQTRLKAFGLKSILIKNFVPRPKIIKDHIKIPHFSYVGVLEKHKGVDTLVDAYSKTNCKSELHIFGSGSLSKYIENVGDRRIKLFGFLPGNEVLSNVASSNCLCAPSRCCENSPLSCIEALSVGVPLIVLPNGGLPEMAAGCGITVENKQDLIQALESVENNREMRIKMSEYALKKYEEEHSPSAFMKQYISLLENNI